MRNRFRIIPVVLVIAVSTVAFLVGLAVTANEAIGTVVWEGSCPIESFDREKGFIFSCPFGSVESNSLINSFVEKAQKDGVISTEAHCIRRKTKFGIFNTNCRI
jgi:hypothetical protein